VWSPRSEIDDPVLVAAEHSVQATADQDGDGGEGAERPVRDDHIAPPEFTVREGGLRDFV
jgi:hypothetical protein